MLASLFPHGEGIGEIGTPVGRALIAERYSAVRQQVPVIYLLAVANLSGLELATQSELTFGLNFPTVLTVCALVRSVQWLRASPQVNHATMLRRLRQACWLAGGLCISVGIWCVSLFAGSDQTAPLAVLLFGGLTAIGTAYGLSVLPTAARLALFGLALPLAGAAAFSRDPQFVGAALSLGIVAILVLRLLTVHNAHFTELIKSRTLLAEEQELTESARQEAVVAATTDFLTGLPNRRAFLAALDGAIADGEGSFAVAVLDLDNFKHINDTLGHVSGDQLLQIIARRLVSVARPDIVVARLGGDEFGLLLRNAGESNDVTATGLQILAAVESVTEINGREVVAGASIGFCFWRESSSQTASRVLAEADFALYEAKRSTGPHLSLFEPRMEAPYQRKRLIEAALRLPDVHKRISLVYQPIFDFTSRRIVAMEALARWSDPELGQVSPAEFVPIAEQLNVIGPISEHLMQSALAQASRWPPNVSLSFNLSGVQLCAPDLANMIIGALEAARLDPRRLHVEVTETALLRDFEQARQNLATVRAHGVTIVLDDFGAGYASIGYLRQLTFDQIKLDGALIDGARDTPDGKRLLAAVIGLCQALGVSTVAENIEDDDQRRLAAELGCTAGQGYWLKPPMPAQEALEFARADAARATLCTIDRQVA